MERNILMTETIPADGYATAESITFVVENTAEIQKVEMKDDVTKVQISKTDISGKELPGAKLTVLDKDGNAVESWTSEESRIILEKLPIGDYILREGNSTGGISGSRRCEVYSERYRRDSERSDEGRGEADGNTNRDSGGSTRNNINTGNKIYRGNKDIYFTEDDDTHRCCFLTWLAGAGMAGVWRYWDSWQKRKNKNSVS